MLKRGLPILILWIVFVFPIIGCQTKPVVADSEMLKVIREEPYYVSGPMQGRPPEGRVKAGTVVTALADRIGNYQKVRLPDGVEAYVDRSGLELIR